MPERIQRLAFCNAFVLNDGESLSDNVPPRYNALFETLLQPDGGVMLPFPIFSDGFINDADKTTARAAFGTLLPTPRRSQIDKVPLKTFFSLQTPKSYLNCTENTALPLGPEFGWHPHMSQRLGLYRPTQMPGSREVRPGLTLPAAFAGNGVSCLLEVFAELRKDRSLRTWQNRNLAHVCSFACKSISKLSQARSPPGRRPSPKDYGTGGGRPPPVTRSKPNGRATRPRSAV